MKQLNWLTGTAVIFAMVLSQGCGTDPEDAAEALPPVEIRTLTVTDSISGGDEIDCLFGAIEAAEITVSGDVLVLDVARCCVFRFAPDGTSLGEIASEGSGPGELTYPADMTILEDGTVAVNDPMKAAVLLFSPDSGFTGSIEGFPMTPVRDMHPAPGGGFIGWRSSLETADDQYMTVIRVGHWVTDGDPVTVYWERAEATDMSSFAAMMKQSLYAVTVTADSQGRVFVAPLSTGEYSIECFSPEGELFTTISMQLPRTPRSEDEMELETYIMETRMRSMGDHGMAPVWEPDPYRVMVGEMGTDADGRLWARRGTEEWPTFDIFDPESGERLFSAELDYPGSTSGWVFSIGPRGILAWSMDAESCQAVYRLGLPD